MIDLKLKAEFDTDGDPFLLKLKDKNLPSGIALTDSLTGEFQNQINFLDIITSKGRIKVFKKSDDSFHDDVILCIPKKNIIQRLYRANSFNNTFLFTERCDQLCAMCSQPPKSSIDEWRFPFYQKTIELSNTNSTIGISGGEPTLYKEDLFKILKNTYEKRSDVKMHILTNGQHFEDDDMKELTKINENLEVLWGIPLYSAKKENHDEIVGKKGAFNKLLPNLFKVAGSGAAIELRSVLTKKNALDLPELALFVSKHLPFVNKWVIMAMEPIGFAKANKKELFFDHSIVKFPIENAIDIAALNGIHIQLYNFPLCTVDQEYREYCSQSISDWKNKYVDECQDCSQKDNCCGFFEWYTESWKWENIKSIN